VTQNHDQFCKPEKIAPAIARFFAQ
jgi:hypothetical protein